MADHPTQSPEELSRIVADYMRRIDAGEPIDREAFLAEHPDLRDELQRYLDDVALVEQLAGPAVVEPNKADASPAIRTVAESVHDDSIPAASSQRFDGLPEEFGRYRIEKRLGAGAMGSVFLARDTELDRQVALKIPKFDDESEMTGRFYREARSAAKIHHRHICPVFDVGEIGGIRYISMAYIEGRTLADYIDPNKPQTDRQIALLVRKLALALAEAHRRAVIHRDLKPANIMIDPNSEPVIMDFGLARQTDKEQQSRLTQTGTIMGTPMYMSPEQVDGDLDRIGPVSDVYSLGIISYELLAGHPPFQGSLTSVLAQIVTRQPAPISKYRPDVDPRLEAICLKMIAKQIPDRYQSMNDAAEALTRFLKQPRASSAPLLRAVPKGDSNLTGYAPQDKPAVSPADTPTDRSDTLLKQLQQQRDKAKELAKRHQYAAAVQVLEQIVRQEDPSCQKYVDWAAKEIDRLKALPEKYRRQIPHMLEAAHKLIAAHDYAQAAALLQDFPAPLRTDEIQRLLDKTIELQDEVDLLIADIDDAVQHKQFEGLLPNVERLLELQPARTKTRELYERLTGYGPKTVFRGSRALEKKKYQEGPWGLFSGRLALVLTLAFVGVIGLVIAGVTIYVKTGKGTLKITLHDKTVRLSLDGEALKIQNLGEPLTVRATDHELIVERDGLETKTKRFTLKRGETLAIEVAVVSGRLAILTDGEKPPPGKSIANTKPPVKPASGGSDPPGGSTSGSDSGSQLVQTGEFGANVSHVRFSQDGRSVIGLTWDNDIRPEVRDLATGKRLRLMDKGWGSQPNGGFPTALALSPVDTLAAGASSKGKLMLWDYDSGKLLREFVGHTKGIPEVVFTPDGKRLLSSSNDYTIRVWNVASGKQERLFDKTNAVTVGDALAITPDGNYFVEGAGKQLNYRNLESGKVIWSKTDVPGKLLQECTFSSDGKQLATISTWPNYHLTIYDTTDGRELRRLSHQLTSLTPARDLRFLADERWLLSAHADGGKPSIALLWDIDSGRVLQEIDGAGSADVSPDGLTVVTKETKMKVRVWRLKTGVPVGRVNLFNGKDYDRIATGRWIDVFKVDPPKTDGDKIQFKDGVLELKNTSLPLPRLTGRNMIVRAKVKKLSGRNLGFGLRCREVKGVRADVAWMNSLTFVGIGRNVNSVWKDLKNQRIRPNSVVSDEDGFVELTFAAIDDHLTMYINGRKTIDITDGTHDNGFVSLMAPRGRSLFKNIQVMLLDEKSTTGTDGLGRVNLFNGKDLSGWKPMVDASKWSVKQGVLTGTGKLGWISTDRQFSDFELELEFRLGTGGNSGIFLRAPHAGATNGADFLEVQLLDDSYRRFRKLKTNQITGALYGLAPVSQRAGIKAKTWSKVRIKALGRQVTVWVNDRQILDANLDDYPQQTKQRPNILRPRGYIGLQRMSPIEFRNIRIRELDKNGQPLASADIDRAVAAWVLSVGGSVTIASAGKTGVSIKSEAEVPRKPFLIEGLSLGMTKVTDADLAHLKGLTHLRSLISAPRRLVMPA